MVERGALAQVRLDQRIPVVINHDRSRVIGHVREIVVREDVISGTDVALWHFAHVDLDDPPIWLERNITGVSWAHNDLWSWKPPGSGRGCSGRGSSTRLAILTPSTKPAEPLARVVWFEKKASSPAAVIASDPAVGDPLKPARIYAATSARCSESASARKLVCKPIQTILVFAQATSTPALGFPSP